MFQGDPMTYLECFRSLIRAISVHENEISKLCDENRFQLSYFLIRSQQVALEDAQAKVDATNNSTSE